MEIGSFKKISKYDGYTINEFVKELIKTKNEGQAAVVDIDSKIEVLKQQNIKLMSEEEKVERRANLAELRKEKRQVERYIKKFEDEKGRIKSKLDSKIEEISPKVKENATKIQQNEQNIQENEERLKDLDEDSTEYQELVTENVKLSKQISHYKGNITRYNNKMNHIKEIQGNLEAETVLELNPPQEIKSKPITLEGIRTRQIEQQEPVQSVQQEQPVGSEQREQPVEPEHPVQENLAHQEEVVEQIIEQSVKTESENPYSNLTVEELEAKQRELWAKIPEQDDYLWRTHYQNGMGEYEEDWIDRELKAVREEIEKRKVEEKVQPEEVKPEEIEQEATELEKPEEIEKETTELEKTEEIQQENTEEIKKLSFFEKIKEFLKRMLNSFRKKDIKLLPEDTLTVSVTVNGENNREKFIHQIKVNVKDLMLEEDSTNLEDVLEREEETR